MKFYLGKTLIEFPDQFCYSLGEIAKGLKKTHSNVFQWTHKPTTEHLYLPAFKFTPSTPRVLNTDLAAFIKRVYEVEVQVQKYLLPEDAELNTVLVAQLLRCHPKRILANIKKKPGEEYYLKASEENKIRFADLEEFIKRNYLMRMQQAA